MAKLTAKQEAFCQEYIVDLNGTKAYLRVYPDSSKKAAESSASDLLRNPKVAARIQELMDMRSKRTEVTADYVLGKIVETIERCSQAEPVYEMIDGEKVPTGEWKFEHGGVLKGAELLGKHLKLWTDKIDVSGKVTLEDLVAGAQKAEEKE